MLLLDSSYHFLEMINTGDCAFIALSYFILSSDWLKSC